MGDFQWTSITAERTSTIFRKFDFWGKRDMEKKWEKREKYFPLIKML
jgi:hypothetical protein